jgi:hypothetical protein
MLSYKQYKALNESIMPSFTLGLGKPNNLGLISPFAEAKKSKKKMDIKLDNDEDIEDDIEDDDETGDGETVQAASEKDEPEVDVHVDKDDEGGCGCGKTCKKSKKKMWKDDDDFSKKDTSDEDDGEEGSEEAADEEGEEDDGESSEKALDDKHPKSESDPDMESGEEISSKGPFYCKKSKKKMCSDSDVHKAIEKEEEKEHKDLDGDKEKGESKKHKEKVLGKDKVKKESAEMTESEKWLKSVVGPPAGQTYSDGLQDYLDFQKTYDQINNPSANPGDVGFAPQQKLGLSGSFFS